MNYWQIKQQKIQIKSFTYKSVMKFMHLVSIFILLAVSVNCGKVFLGYSLQNTSYYQCFLEAGNSNILLDTEQENNAISKNTTQNINNAKNAGLQIEVVMSICRNRTVDQSVQVIKTAFPDKLFERAWLHLPTNQTTPACGWQNYPPTDNCQYLQDLISKIQQNLRISSGIYTARAKWYQAFKSYQGCSAVSNSPLWYVPEKIPEQANFNDYKQIGGWSQPNLKIYNFSTVCGATVFENYFK